MEKRICKNLISLCSANALSRLVKITTNHISIYYIIVLKAK